MSGRVQGKPAAGYWHRFFAALACTAGASLITVVLLAVAGLPFWPLLLLAMLGALFVAGLVTR